MGVKKLMTYGRYALVVFLVIYLLLVWMYFKDNASNLTSSGLLIWFIIIPSVLFLSIIVIKWSQKKLERKSVDQPDIHNKEEKAKQPDTYQLFMYSSICLPEGDSWSEIVDNNEDLTTLSENLSDFDGLPVLIKPIARVNTEAALLYAYNNGYGDNADYDHEGFDNTELDSAENTDKIDSTQYAESIDGSSEAPDALTSRLWALIHEQFTLSDESLSALAQHFDSINQKNTYPSNSAVHIHPEWQQHYIASSDEHSSDEGSIDKGNSDKNNSEASSSPVIALIQLSVYLCIPASADSTFLMKSIKQQLAVYGIPEQLLTIKTFVTNDVDSTADTELHQPTQFMNEHLVALSKSTSPEACLFIAVDSQINEEWLESQLYVDAALNNVPTEAGTLLMFCNQAAQDILNIDSQVSFSLTEISAASNNITIPANVNTRQHYLNNLTKIKQLLLDNSFVLSQLDKTQSQIEEKRHKEPTDNKTITNALLAESSIIALSDINPSKQPYDLSAFMTFIEEFIEKGALVNEHHLGHYMPSNSWLKPLMSLALLIDLASEQQQELDLAFLITQHKRCFVLWLANFSEAS